MNEREEEIYLEIKVVQKKKKWKIAMEFFKIKK